MEGKTNAEIAEITGKSLSRINALFSGYKIEVRDRTLPQETIDMIRNMKQNGSSTKEIMETTGVSKSTVDKYAPAAGIESYVFELQREMVIERKPRIFRTIVNGKRYLDITDLWL